MDENNGKAFTSRTSVKKDTIQLITSHAAHLRFKANNPGYWLFHCHIDGHMMNGMIMIIKVRPYFYFKSKISNLKNSPMNYSVLFDCLVTATFKSFEHTLFIQINSVKLDDLEYYSHTEYGLTLVVILSNL